MKTDMQPPYSVQILYLSFPKFITWTLVHHAIVYDQCKLYYL